MFGDQGGLALGQDDHLVTSPSFGATPAINPNMTNGSWTTVRWVCGQLAGCRWIGAQDVVGGHEVLVTQILGGLGEGPDAANIGANLGLR